MKKAQEKQPVTMNLGNLRAPQGARRPAKRVGRGEGSGHGGTSTRGHKGQKARAGGFHKLGFEGGQMPLLRRLPKRGFRPPFRRVVAIVNVGDLAELPKGSVVDAGFLVKERFVRGGTDGVKILGDGEIKTPLIVKGLLLSASARKKIEAAGGKIEEAKG